MIVEPVTSELDSSFPSQKYAIGNLALLQQAVSDRMYKNKHLAVVRELLANARDAHRESGIPHVPAHITFPSHGDSHLRIKDFGPGVNLKRMTTSFTGYCASTKTADNRMTGGFGLGCKTPFAVAQSFMVETTSDDEDGVRRHRVWSHHKDAEGLSSYAILSEREAPDAPTGTEIAIPVSLDDRYRYVDAFKSICKWWSPIPETEREADRPEPENLNMWDERTSFHTISLGKHRAIVDGIPYEIPWKLNIYGSITLWFDTGELPVTLTRDALDSKAESKIVERIRDTVHKAMTEPPKSLRWALQTSHRLNCTVPYPGWSGIMSMPVPEGLRVRLWKESGNWRRGRNVGPERFTSINLLEIMDSKVVINQMTRVDTSVVAARAEKGKHEQVYYIHRYRKELDPESEAFLEWIQPFAQPWEEWEPTIKDTIQPPVPKPRAAYVRYNFWDTDSNRLTPWKHALPDRACYVIRQQGQSRFVDRGDGVELVVRDITSMEDLGPNVRPRASIPVIAVRDATLVPPGWISWTDLVRAQIKRYDRLISHIIYGDPRKSDFSEFWNDLREVVSNNKRHPLAYLWKIRDTWEAGYAALCSHREWRGLLGLPAVGRENWPDPNTLIPDAVKDLYQPHYSRHALSRMTSPDEVPDPEIIPAPGFPALQPSTTKPASHEVHAA